MASEHAALPPSATGSAEEPAHMAASSPLSSVPSAFDEPPDLPSPPSFQQPTTRTTAPSGYDITARSSSESVMGFKKADFKEVSKDAPAQGDAGDAWARQLVHPAASSLASFQLPRASSPHKSSPRQLDEMPTSSKAPVREASPSPTPSDSHTNKHTDDDVHPARRHNLASLSSDRAQHMSKRRSRSPARGPSRPRSPFRATRAHQYEDDYRSYRDRASSSSDSRRERAHRRRRRQRSAPNDEHHARHDDRQSHRSRSQTRRRPQNRQERSSAQHQRSPSRSRSPRSQDRRDLSRTRYSSERHLSSFDSYRPAQDSKQRNQRQSSRRQSSHRGSFDASAHSHRQPDSYRPRSSPRDSFGERGSQRSQRGSSSRRSSGRDFFDGSAPHCDSSGRPSSRSDRLDDTPAYMQRRWQTQAQWSELPLQSTFVPAQDDGGEFRIKGIAELQRKQNRQHQPPKDMPQYDGADDSESPPPVKRPGPRAGKTWATDHLLQNAKSKLTKVDLMSIFKHPKAWEVLSDEQKTVLVNLISDAAKAKLSNTDLGMALHFTDIVNDTAFRSSVALFQQDLAEGRLDPDWQLNAALAMEQRARGDFDEWKNNEMERFWGQKQKIAHGVLVGDSGTVTFPELVEAGCFRVGDVWSYTRNFGKGKTAIKVEKEATIASITADNALTFTLPPGTAKFSAPAAGADLATPPIHNVQKLADVIIHVDGRVPTWRGSNAWKEFRCIRANQDMGSPWDIRELQWARSSASQQPVKKQARSVSKRQTKGMEEAGEE